MSYRVILMFLVSFIRQLAFTLPAQRLNQKFEIHGNLQFEQIFSQSDTKVVNVISMKKNKVYLMCFVEQVQSHVRSAGKLHILSVTCFPFHSFEDTFLTFYKPHNE